MLDFVYLYELEIFKEFLKFLCCFFGMMFKFFRYYVRYQNFNQYKVGNYWEGYYGDV